jgi:DNA-binding transcriptional ArsR family regulator
MTNDICERRIIHEDRLAKARGLLPDQNDIERMGNLFKAMADPGRVQILMALDVQEMCVCDLAALLGVSESAASHQMRILRNMNLVKNRREGQVLYYRLVDEHVMQLIRVARSHVFEMAGG